MFEEGQPHMSHNTQSHTFVSAQTHIFSMALRRSRASLSWHSTINRTAFELRPVVVSLEHQSVLVRKATLRHWYVLHNARLLYMCDTKWLFSAAFVHCSEMFCAAKRLLQIVSNPNICVNPRDQTNCLAPDDNGTQASHGVVAKCTKRSIPWGGNYVCVCVCLPPSIYDLLADLLLYRNLLYPVHSKQRARGFYSSSVNRLALAHLTALFMSIRLRMPG